MVRDAAPGQHPHASSPAPASGISELGVDDPKPLSSWGSWEVSSLQRPDSSLVEGQKVSSKQAGLKDGSSAWNQEEGPSADPSCAASWTGAGREPGLGTLLGHWEVTNAHIGTEPLPGPRPQKSREETGWVTKARAWATSRKGPRLWTLPLQWDSGPFLKPGVLEHEDANF